MTNQAILTHVAPKTIIMCFAFNIGFVAFGLHRERAKSGNNNQCRAIDAPPGENDCL